jgi:hypothetical protein
LPTSTGFGSERLPSRECEKPARQSRRALGATSGIVQSSLEISGSCQLSRMPLRGLKVAEHNHQEIVEVVRDAAAELADRLHFL